MEVVRLLLAAHADTNRATADDGTTPLFMASQNLGFLLGLRVLGFRV